MDLERKVMILALLGSGGLLSSTCVTTKACTEVGCNDQFSATIEAPLASLPPGMHRLEVIADGTTLTCTFSVPLEPPASGGWPDPVCSAGLSLSVGPAVMCTTFETDAIKGQRCDPIPDRVSEHLYFSATPTQVAVTQWAGDTMIFQQTATPTYQVSYPNGPDCGPACRQGSVTWSIP